MTSASFQYVGFHYLHYLIALTNLRTSEISYIVCLRSEVYVDGLVNRPLLEVLDEESAPILVDPVAKLE